MRRMFLTRAANLLSTLRFFLAFLFLVLFDQHALIAQRLLVLTSLAIPVSDVLDGYVARRQGSAKIDKSGAVLDSLADDIAMIAVLVCLMSVQVLPVWFVVLALWTRSIICLIRLLTAIQRLPYARPRLSTKAKGASYWAGLVVLVVQHTTEFEGVIPFQGWLIRGVIYIMTLLTIAAMIDFSFANRKMLASLFNDGSVSGDH